jgi:hypothetical protein
VVVAEDAKVLRKSKRPALEKESPEQAAKADTTQALTPNPKFQYVYLNLNRALIEPK